MALISNDDKKSKTSDGIILYLYEKLCKTELLGYLPIDTTLIIIHKKVQ